MLKLKVIAAIFTFAVQHSLRTVQIHIKTIDNVKFMLFLTYIMKYSICFILHFLVFFSIIPTGYSSEPSSIVGFAYGIKSGKLLYKEIRSKFWENKSHLPTFITYKNPQGKTFAVKKLNYESNTIAPNYEIIDYRNGYTEGFKKTLENKYLLYYKEKKGDDLQKKEIKKVNNMIADAGFNHFIMKNWDKLLKGETIYCNFVAPSELDTYRFKIFKIKESVYNGIPVVTVRTQISNLLFRLFVDNNDTTYTKNTVEVVAYEGTSNILNSEGKRLHIRMKFSD